ncbi:MAG TPA: DNA polymerase III subunit delta' [Blastocatellia bacterium]|nr:DNA polymerase III subunit delta' [Blastocatellia bacterium]
MSFSSLVGNDRIKQWLRRAVAEDRIGQGLILAGPDGVGKHQFALALSQAVNCENPVVGEGCGSCLACRKIERNEHPDVKTILRESRDPDFKKEAKSQFIKIDQMRQMSNEAQFRPYIGRRRVFMIDEAEWLREDAASSILKTLEEPPETSLLILITSKPYALLETIRSRCLMLSFAPLTPAEIESHLKLTTKRPADEIAVIARLARGSIGRALEIELQEYREKRERVVDLLESLSLARDSARLMSAAEYLGRKLERDEFQDHLDVLNAMLSDVFHLKAGEPPASLINADVAERLQRIADAVTISQIIEWSEKLQEILLALARNVNRQLAMEEMLIRA